MLIQGLFNKLFLLEKADDTIRVYHILEQSKETILEFSKGTTKVL